MDNERFIVDVDHTADSVTCSEGSQGSGVVLDDSMVITVFDLLMRPLSEQNS